MGNIQKGGLAISKHTEEWVTNECQEMKLASSYLPCKGDSNLTSWVSSVQLFIVLYYNRLLLLTLTHINITWFVQIPCYASTLKFSSSFYSISLIVHFHHLVFFSTLLSLVFKYINSSHHAISHIPNPQGFVTSPFFRANLFCMQLQLKQNPNLYTFHKTYINYTSGQYLSLPSNS